jgi:hypothetical protein
MWSNSPCQIIQTSSHWLLVDRAADDGGPDGRKDSGVTVARTRFRALEMMLHAKLAEEFLRG